MGLLFPHIANWHRPRGINVFVPQVLDLLMYGRISYSGMGTYPARVRRDLDIVWRGNSRCALAPLPSRSSISRWGWCFHTVHGGIDPGITTLVPAVSELQIYGSISDSVMGSCRPRMRRDLDFCPRANYHRDLAPLGPPDY